MDDEEIRKGTRRATADIDFLPKSSATRSGCTTDFA